MEAQELYNKSFKRLIYQKQKSAKKRGHDWQLTDEIAIRLFNGKCRYCGVEPYQTFSRMKDTSVKTNNSGEYPDVIKYNGIDRVNSSFGYIPGNCVSCCGMCNMLKGRYTVEDVKDWAKRVCNKLLKTKIKDNAKTSNNF